MFSRVCPGPYPDHIYIRFNIILPSTVYGFQTVSDILSFLIKIMY
jgi:hypothetical protein